LKDAYWEIVVDCLERFHGYSRSAAWEAASNLRSDLSSLPTGETLPPYDVELFYNEEPYYMACDIAGRDLPPGVHDREYQAVVRERYAPAEERLMRSGVLPPLHAGV
jgi:hypothetical protein